MTLRRRPSDPYPWYDDACKKAKRLVRRCERRIIRFIRLCSHDPSLGSALTRAKEEYKRGLVSYRTLLCSTKEQFWCARISAERHSPRELWRSIDSLLGRGRPPPSELVSATDFLQHFEKRVAEARDATTSVPIPDFPAAPPRFAFSCFRRITLEMVVASVRRLPNKSSSCDVLPTTLLKNCISILAPFLVHLFNTFLSSGVFPTFWKAATITPIPKTTQDYLDVKSYRAISNLPVLSKVLERLVSSQLRSHLDAHSLLPCNQSAYRPQHSTETAILKLSSDVLLSLSLSTGAICV